MVSRGSRDPWLPIHMEVANMPSTLVPQNPGVHTHCSPSTSGDRADGYSAWLLTWGSWPG